MYPFEPNSFAKLIDIPEILRSDLTGEHLSNCVICDSYLLDDDTLYMIEKALINHKKFETYETIFEFAVCLECGGDKQGELSEESLININEYVFKNMPAPFQRAAHLGESETPDINRWLEQCIIKGTPRKEIGEYEIVAACKGKQLIADYMPFIIGDEAMEEMQGLLSQKTQDELDRFVDDNFGLPPELKELLKDKPLVLV